MPLTRTGVHPSIHQQQAHQWPQPIALGEDCCTAKPPKQVPSTGDQVTHRGPKPYQEAG
jgi:hypothetical protein